MSSASASASKRWIWLWSALWAILAIGHVTRSIWSSGLAAYPGGLGDGRFNQLVLEHGHQALKGIYEWDSPGQYYPAKGTLAYSDTHAGTLPIYTVMRRLSISREEAWQMWFVVVCALNVWATFRIGRALQIPVLLRGPLVFASAGSATMVWLAGTHMQMLPLFPALFGWEQLIEFRRDRAASRVAAAAGFFAWQFAAVPYAFWFATVITVAVGIGVLVTRPSRAPLASTNTAQPIVIVGRLAVFAFGMLLAAVVARVYLLGVRDGHSRPISEVLEFAPAFTSWFTASPIHFFYRAGWPGGQTNLNEHAWLAGFLPWGVTVIALIFLWRARRSPYAAWSLALGLGAVLAAAFFTAWPHQRGAWIWVAQHVETLRGFRAAGRCASLVQFVLVGSAGLLLSHIWANSRTRVTQGATLLFAVLLAVETLTARQPHTLRSTARARTEAMVAAWERSGDRPVLVFAPANPAEPLAWLYLDAWSGALEKHRVTLNGYSGGYPRSHGQFLFSPTPADAKAVAAQVGIPAEDLSIVQTVQEER